MATIATQKPGLAGLAVAYTAAAGGGDTYVNTGVEKIRVKNASGAGITVTIDSLTPCDQGVDHNLAISVAAGEEKEIGPLPPARFGGSPSITYSAVTSVTVAVTA